MKLEDYIELEGTEWGDACEMLVNLPSYYYIFSDEFNKAISNEMEYQLKRFKDSTKIIEHKEEYVTFIDGKETRRESRTVIELEFYEVEYEE